MLLLATVALTGCRFAEHSRRAAIDAFASFVLDSVFRMESKAPLKEKVAAAPRGRQALPVPVPPPEERHECLSYTTAEISKLPVPQPHIAAISLTPAPAICRVRRVYIVPATATIAQARVAARMALAELRAQREIRIVVDIPEIPDPAAL